jgi:hypothetical protein
MENIFIIKKNPDLEINESIEKILNDCEIL